MNIGLKIYSTNTESFPKLFELFQSGIIKYVELYIVPGQFQPEVLSLLKRVPIIFHAPNYNHHFSITRKDKTFQTAMSTIEKFVDFFQENKIIIHPGYILSPTDNPETLIKTMGQYPWLDFILENVPAIALDHQKGMVASSLDDFKMVLHKTKAKFCLDFGHAAAAAKFYGIETITFVRKLLELTPYMFHICDAHDQDTDSHLHLGEGDLPLKVFKQMIKNEYVSLETPKTNFSTLAEDIENIKRLKQL
jgi:sugar phosphate isomerase/epimerase